MTDRSSRSRCESVNGNLEAAVSYLTPKGEVGKPTCVFLKLIHVDDRHGQTACCRAARDFVFMEELEKDSDSTGYAPS